MHEYSLAQKLLEQVDVIRREQHADRVVSVQLSVGEFSGVEPELLQSAFQTLIRDTSLSGAVLVMDRIPLRSRCNDCDCRFVVHRFRFECPNCSGRDVTVTGGDGLILQSVTLEQADALPAQQATEDHVPVET